MSTYMNNIMSPIPTVIFSTLIVIGSRYFDIPIIKTGLACTAFYVGMGYLGYKIMDKMSKDESTKFLNILPFGVSVYKIFIFWATITSIYNFNQYGLPYLRNFGKFLF